MIIRLGNTLAKKIKETVLPSAAPDPNPFADWSTRLFTADRTQYILISNTATLYSTVIYGRGISDADRLIHGMTESMRDVMNKDGFESTYLDRVAPETARIFLSKTLNRSVIGSMNELVFAAKWHLIRDEMSPFDASFRLNDVPLSCLKYGNPREAFRSAGQRLYAVR